MNFTFESTLSHCLFFMAACHIITTINNDRKKYHQFWYSLSAVIYWQRKPYTYKSRKWEREIETHIHNYTNTHKENVNYWHFMFTACIDISQPISVHWHTNKRAHCLSTKWKKSHIEINEQSNNSMLSIKCLNSV